MKPIGIAVLLGGLVVFGGIFYFAVLDESVPNCPGHWHATFAVFVPDETGAPTRIDFAAPRAPSGQLYYQLNVDPSMTVGSHMHLDGAEAGIASVAASQWHFEGNKCVGIQTAMKTADVNLQSSSLTVNGAHGLAHAGSWSDSGDNTVRVFWESQDKVTKFWSWSEVKASSVLHTQPKDGESFLVTYGHYTDAQVHDMEKQVPPPISRTGGEAPTTTVASASSTVTPGTT